MSVSEERDAKPTCCEPCRLRGSDSGSAVDQHQAGCARRRLTKNKEMGACMSSSGAAPASKEDQKNAQLDAQLEIDKLKSELHYKLLVLGAGERYSNPWHPIGNRC